LTKREVIFLKLNGNSLGEVVTYFEINQNCKLLGLVANIKNTFNTGKRKMRVIEE